MSYVVGLTGSIGMGKSTTAKMFAAAGIPVWDADLAVHRLYAPGGAAVAPLAALYPPALVDGGIDRNTLKAWIAKDPAALSRIEEIVHPLVAADRAAFLVSTDAPIVVVDIPLLFETKGDAAVDHIVVVSAPAEVQRARVLARSGMTEERFHYILSKQVPDAEKRARADTVIETTTLAGAETQVRALIDKLREQHA